MKRLPTCGIAVLLLAMAGCGPETPPDAPPPSRSYQAGGVLQAFLPDGVHIRVRHDAIPGLMEGMTMSFAVADTSLLRGLAEGDSIRFVLTATGDDLAITRLDRK